MPQIHMYGPNSKQEEMLNLKYACMQDADGIFNCFTTGKKETQRPDPGPIPKGTKRKCSGSCSDPNDCDINYDCLCASNKGMCCANLLYLSHCTVLRSKLSLFKLRVNFLTVFKYD